ncbi:hypothetical protein Anas_09971 [Armadillidium nasatum]|uniref:Uncharacterized protein n=1 Tax=Armadillidium nasatum TaxID=96803 RepID=A0A5N5TDJ4_9CRUS|nr:hypothetical protein Anas_09971 [Armadillidium nasatum]
MNLEAKLKLSIYFYRIAKIIQLLYQISFVYFLYEYREEEDLTNFILAAINYPIAIKCNGSKIQR